MNHDLTPPAREGERNRAERPTAISEASEVDGYFGVLFRAIPCPVLIVDLDMTIEHANPAGMALLGQPTGSLRRRSGDALHCLHAAETPGGCGHSASCEDCVLRNSVRSANQGGEVVRAKARLQLQQGGQTKEVYLLVSASPFRFEGKPLFLLHLEDISELMVLKSLLPMCAWCGKIRDDRDYWNSVEEYFKEQADIRFTHGICPECAQTMAPGVQTHARPSPSGI